jgi:protein transport protein SEC61 subunit alpha
VISWFQAFAFKRNLYRYTSVFPSLSKLQKEEGEAGRRKFQQYQRYGRAGLSTPGCQVGYMDYAGCHQLYLVLTLQNITWRNVPPLLCGALGFAVVQAVGQCLYVRPYVEDFSLGWLVESSCVLTAGAMILLYIGEVLNELKLGNGRGLEAQVQNPVGPIA